MEYTITELKGPYDSNYPDSKKYNFRVEGYDHELSGFSKFPLKVDDKINGSIVLNGNYHNFKFQSKPKYGAPASPASAIENRTLEAINTNLTEIAKMVRYLYDQAPKTVAEETLGKVEAKITHAGTDVGYIDPAEVQFAPGETPW